MYMILDIGYAGSIDHQYCWNSVSALRPFQRPDDTILECRKLMNLITKAIDSQCRQICDRKKSLEEIRRLFMVYVTLSSYARQAETERVRSKLDEQGPSVPPEYVSVPCYEDELIQNK